MVCVRPSLAGQLFRTGLGQSRPVLCSMRDKGGIIAARRFRFSRCLWACSEKGLKCVREEEGYSRAGNVS